MNGFPRDSDEKNVASLVGNTLKSIALKLHHRSIIIVRHGASSEDVLDRKRGT